MTVAYGGATESHTGTTGYTTSGGSFSFDGPSPFPNTFKGVIVFVFTVPPTSDDNGFRDTGVTYGGVAMTNVGEASDVAGEPGTIRAYFLNENIPAGTASVVVSCGAGTEPVYAVCMAALGDKKLELTGTYWDANSTLYSENGDGTFTAYSLNTGSRVALRMAAGYSGLAAPLAAASGSSLGPSIDFGARTCNTCYETYEGSGARDIGFSAGSDDRAALYLALAELQTTAITGSISNSFSVTSSLKGKGTLTSAVSTALSLSGSGFAGRGALATSSPMASAVSGTLYDATANSTYAQLSWIEFTVPIAVGGMAGIVTLSTVVTGQLTGKGLLSSVVPLTISPSALLTGTAYITGTASLAFAVPSTLTGRGPLASVISNVFSASGAMSGIGDLISTAAALFNVDGGIHGRGPLTTTIPISFSSVGAFSPIFIYGDISFSMEMSGVLYSPTDPTWASASGLPGNWNGDASNSGNWVEEDSTSNVWN